MAKGEPRVVLLPGVLVFLDHPDHIGFARFQVGQVDMVGEFDEGLGRVLEWPDIELEERPVAMAGDEHLGLGPVIVGGNREHFLEELEPAKDLNEASLADQVGEGRPRRFSAVAASLSRLLERVDHRELVKSRVEALEEMKQRRS